MKKAAQYKSFLHLVFWILPVVLGLDQVNTLLEKEREEREAQAMQMARPQEVATVPPPPSEIETLLPVPDGFKSVAVVTKIEYSSVIQGFGSVFQRRILRVSLPEGLALTDVDTNLRKVARKAFEEGAMSVKVVAHESGGHLAISEEPVATLVFAPEGEWDRTDHIYSLDTYETVIQHGDSPPTRVNISDPYVFVTGRRRAPYL